MSITSLGNATWSVTSQTAGTQSSAKTSASTATSKTNQEADEYISSTGTVATRESLKLEQSEQVLAQSSQLSAASAVVEEEETTVNTVGKPTWISDEHWAAIQENSNEQPSGMSDEDWQAYLQWAGKASSTSSSTQNVETTEQIASDNRATSTSKEIASRSSSENANQYALRNAESAAGTRIDISA